MKATHTWSLEQLNEIENDLGALQPQPKRFTKKEAIEKLKESILQAKKKEHTIESIKEFFDKKGLKISQRELKEIFEVAVKPKKMVAKKPPSVVQNTLQVSEAVVPQV